MQYQVFKEETGELVAWIDTSDSKGITLSGYAIKSGEDLTCRESDELTVARFEKVDSLTYHASCQAHLHDIPKFGVVGTTKYHSLVELPRRSTEGSAGYDFFIPYDLDIQPGQTVFIPTGIKVALADGFVLKLYPRSSLGFKYKLSLDNTVGIIDSDYYNNEDNEGHIQCKMTNHSDKVIYLKEGQAYMQGLIEKYYVTDDDSEYAKAKRVGGIGSTTKK